MTENIKINQMATDENLTFIKNDDGSYCFYIGKEPTVIRIGNGELSIENNELFLVYNSLLLI